MFVVRTLKLDCPGCHRPGFVKVTTSEDTVVAFEIATPGWALVGEPLSDRRSWRCLSCTVKPPAPSVSRYLRRS